MQATSRPYDRDAIGFQQWVHGVHVLCRYSPLVLAQTHLLMDIDVHDIQLTPRMLKSCTPWSLLHPPVPGTMLIHRKRCVP